LESNYIQHRDSFGAAVRWLRQQLEAAGLSRFSPWQALVFCLAVAVAVSSWIHLSFGVVGLSLFTFLAVVGTAIETLRLTAIARSNQLAKYWPEVIDSLQSASSSGLGLIDALAEIARTGPLRLRPIFGELIQRIDQGLATDNSLDWFKARFGQIQADRLVELIRVTSKSGGVGYLDSLREQALRTRSEIALWGELESKQGWVSGTAKLAIVAPWIIVATLSSRPENVAIYNTTEGITILLLGLLVSLLAYRMVTLLGALPRPRRVFTK
jgi:tight adherence protein B